MRGFAFSTMVILAAAPLRAQTTRALARGDETGRSVRRRRWWRKRLQPAGRRTNLQTGRILLGCSSILLAALPAAAQETRCGPSALPLPDIRDGTEAVARGLNVLTHGRGSDAGIFRNGGGHTPACRLNLINGVFEANVDSSPAIVEPAAARVSLHYNPTFPRSVNDGALWAGVGANIRAEAGARAQWRGFTLQLQPEFIYSANRAFAFPHSTTPGRHEFANPYHAAIDYPTRFGTEPLARLTPGQSYLGFGAGVFDLRISTENLWLGPAEVYPIVLSNTASGFPHFRVGTRRPINAYIADLEFQLVYGLLKESAYFDADATNDERRFTIALLTLQPHILPGLHLGIVRAYHDSTTVSGGFLKYLENLVRSPFTYSAGAAEGNSLGGLYARWVLQESGFEAYAEWTREDAFGDLEDLLREPDWTQAYVLGAQKVFLRPGQFSRVYGELIHLGASAPERAGRGMVSYYTHSTIIQGHTQRGQLLGAAIGPGSDAQILGADFMTTHGYYGGRIERTRYDDDTYYRRFARRYGEVRHDVELTLALSYARALGDLELQAGLSVSRRYDRQFLNLAGSGDRMMETNVGTSLGVRWRTGR